MLPLEPAPKQVIICTQCSVHWNRLRFHALQRHECNVLVSGQVILVENRMALLVLSYQRSVTYIIIVNQDNIAYKPTYSYNLLS